MTTKSIVPRAASAALDSIAAVQRRTAEARADLQQTMETLDAAIRDKAAKLVHFQTSSVSRAQVERSIADGLHAYLAEGRARLQEVGSHFSHLNAHRSTSNFDIIDGDGVHRKNTREKRRFSWHEALTTPSGALAPAALALLLSDVDVDAFAEQMARESGAPETGPTLNEIETQANELTDELEALNADRLLLREQLSAFIDISMSPMIPDSFFHRQPTGEGAPQHKGPTVRDLDGRGPKVRSGDVLQVHYAALAMDAEIERQAAAAAGLAPPWDKPLWDSDSPEH